MKNGVPMSFAQRLERLTTGSMIMFFAMYLQALVGAFALWHYSGPWGKGCFSAVVLGGASTMFFIVGFGSLNKSRKLLVQKEMFQ